MSEHPFTQSYDVINPIGKARRGSAEFVYCGYAGIMEGERERERERGRERERDLPNVRFSRGDEYVVTFYLNDGPQWLD